MRIGVIIANKNYGIYIERAIQSAISQTLLPTCICIIDDGSTDDSWSRICKYTNRNLRQEEVVESSSGPVTIKIGHIGDVDIIGIKLTTSVGPSEARNYGINMIIENIELIAVLDADDEMLPTKLEKCIKPFQNKNVGGVYANYYLINEETGVKTLEVKRPYDVFLLQSDCIIHSGSVIRADILKQLKDEYGYYDKTMRVAEDYDLWLRMSKYCSFYHIAEPLTNVLIHSSNSTNSVSKSVWESCWNRIHEKGQSRV